MASDLPIDARVFGAISRAFEAEGFSEDEAYDLAKRGAELLIASEAPAARSAEKPAAAAVFKAADTTISDRRHTEVLSKLATSRRMTLAVLVLSAALIALALFNTVTSVIKARRTENREARSTARRPRQDMDLMPLFVILLVVFGLIIFMMP